ncbi:CP4B1-like protein [Mya arenaria]|uniref:CP4B1-like protein n=1 Tax=Mya arenaria TaxID=6604 RepID=A0ABY7EGE9_MYAAR|nr:CP4B1-like protein [Mya arenaria]
MNLFVSILIVFIVITNLKCLTTYRRYELPTGVKNSKDYMNYAFDLTKTGSKVYCLWTGPLPVVGVTHPETFKQLIGQEHRKARGHNEPYTLIQEWIGEGLLVSGDRKWERSRKLLTPAFHFNILTGYIDVMNTVSDTFQKEHPLEVGQSDRKRRLDFLDILLTATDEHGRGLDREEIQSEVDTFTFEGHDTTGSALAWSIYALGQNPKIQAKVYEDVTAVLGDKNHVDATDLHDFKYLPKYIKEVMRYYSPVPLIARKSAKTLVIDGYEVPPGTRVDINIYATHHNPAIWDTPEMFDPERFDADNKDGNDVFGFIPFSAGNRNCIGQVFALNEIKICLAKFVKRDSLS